MYKTWKTLLTSRSCFVTTARDSMEPKPLSMLHPSGPRLFQGLILPPSMNGSTGDFGTQQLLGNSPPLGFSPGKSPVTRPTICVMGTSVSQSFFVLGGFDHVRELDHLHMVGYRR